MSDVYNSKIAKLFGFFNHSKRWAITFGQTAYYSVSKEEVEKNPGWMVHENKHKEQYKRYGFFGFLIRYIIYSIRYGYDNPLEIEAFQAQIDSGHREQK